MRGRGVVEVPAGRVASLRTRVVSSYPVALIQSALRRDRRPVTDRGLQLVYRGDRVRTAVHAMQELTHKPAGACGRRGSRVREFRRHNRQPSYRSVQTISHRLTTQPRRCGLRPKPLLPHVVARRRHGEHTGVGQDRVWLDAGHVVMSRRAGSDSYVDYWSTDLGVASIRRTTILDLSIMSGIRGPISVAQ